MRKASQMHRFRLWRGLFLCILLAAVVVSCGGKKRPPPPVPGAGSSGRGGGGGPTAPAPPSRRADPGPPSARRASGQPDDSPRIRILLKSGFSREEIRGSARGNRVQVVFQRGEVRLLDEKGRVLESGSGFRLGAGREGALNLDGIAYRGVVDVFVNPLGQPVIVNELTLESYLRGVIANEISLYRQKREAVEVMTIAARTFAYSSLGQNAVRGFDVYSDERSQVYRGIASETETSNRIVEETYGRVVTYQKKPIVAFYSSTCGGLTASYEETFQRKGLPYLRGGASCPDESSPYFSWDDEVDVDRIQPLLDRIVGVGRLKKLVVLEKSRWKRVVSMRFEGSRGQKILKGAQIRSALGLKSNWITHLDTRVDRSGFIVGLRVRGKGWGHGVGLCQIGTMELAGRGWSSERILKHYYEGTEVTAFW